MCPLKEGWGLGTKLNPGSEARCGETSGFLLLAFPTLTWPLGPRMPPPRGPNLSVVEVALLLQKLEN